MMTPQGHMTASGTPRTPSADQAAAIVNAANVARIAELEAALREVLTASAYEQGGKVLDPREAITTGRPLMDALAAARAALGGAK